VASRDQRPEQRGDLLGRTFDGANQRRGDAPRLKIEGADGAYREAASRVDRSADVRADAEALDHLAAAEKRLTRGVFHEERSARGDRMGTKRCVATDVTKSGERLGQPAMREGPCFPGEDDGDEVEREARASFEVGEGSRGSGLDGDEGGLEPRDLGQAIGFEAVALVQAGDRGGRIEGTRTAFRRRDAGASEGTRSIEQARAYPFMRSLFADGESEIDRDITRVEEGSGAGRAALLGVGSGRFAVGGGLVEPRREDDLGEALMKLGAGQRHAGRYARAIGAVARHEAVKDRFARSMSEDIPKRDYLYREVRA